jgi:type 1 fimbriae regulatory protein FimB
MLPRSLRPLSVRRINAVVTAALAGVPVEAHPHMLRHAYGCALADQRTDTRLIPDALGHRNLPHTVRDTATNPPRCVRW